MSKIVFSLFAIILVSAVTLISQPVQQKRDPASLNVAFGKARSDVAVRIIERENNGAQISLTGEISTQFDEMEVEWKLPNGVTLSSGSQTETLHRQGDETILRSRVTVNVPNDLVVPHIVFFAYTMRDGVRVGHSRVFNLKKTGETKAHIAKIKKMMAKRTHLVRE